MLDLILKNKHKIINITGMAGVGKTEGLKRALNELLSRDSEVDTVIIGGDEYKNISDSIKCIPIDESKRTISIQEAVESSKENTKIFIVDCVVGFNEYYYNYGSNKKEFFLNLVKNGWIVILVSQESIGSKLDLLPIFHYSEVLCTSPYVDNKKIRKVEQKL